MSRGMYKVAVETVTLPENVSKRNEIMSENNTHDTSLSIWVLTNGVHHLGNL
jgi:hypothetical protein